MGNEVVAIAPNTRRAEFLQDAQCRVDGEPGRTIARAGPVELRGEAAAVAVRYRRRMERRLRLRARPEKPAAARCEQPLVAIADIPVGAERGHIELELPGRVGAIDQHLRAMR